jgi:hypothetical protein
MQNDRRAARRGRERQHSGVPLRPIWVWRSLLVAFALAYLASGTLQTWIPPLLPFLAAVVVEAQFFFSGLRGPRGRAEPADPGPQERDLAELGWESPDPLPPRRGRGHVRRRLVQAALVLAVVGGLFLLDRSGPTWQKLPAKERAATIAIMEQQAGAIAGHRAEVMCDVSGRHVGYTQDADGLAELGGRRIWLTPEICYRLAKARHLTGATETATGHAIAVLAHEAWHLRGERSEAIANCYAYQSGVGVGRALGLSAGTARRLMHEQLADNPADFADAPAYVVPSGCHRGGSLDLRLDGNHFP